MILRARCLVPMDGLGDPVIEDGAVAIANGRVAWSGRWRECPEEWRGDTRDLGEVALLPGLINAHCHLDYTGMAGQIPAPRHFPDWVKTILSFKAHWSFSEFAESWLKGAKMLLESGTTMVADIESAPELLAEVWPATPLRMISLLELTNVKSRMPPAQVLAEAREWMAKARECLAEAPMLERKETGLSPHALYSTTPELIGASAAAARENGWLLSAHLSESESEFQMFRDAAGPFYDWLKGQRSTADCGAGSPVQIADERGLLGPNLIAAHVNYLAPGDAERIARSGASVAHCPRSHEYFGHDPFPFEALRTAGVNVCLGTDSLASTVKANGKNPELDLRAEMRVFAKAHPGVAPREIWAMATTQAARALGKRGQIGALQAGAHADAVAFHYAGPAREARLCEEILHHGTVREVFIAGELAKPA